MSQSTWSGIRPGSLRLDVYNEACIVYLIDEGSTELLRVSGADFQVGFLRDESLVHPELKQLARDGWFVAYELDQDDEVCVEVVVGKPLTRAELAIARWYKPQKAYLKLPTGRLRVDTANTLIIHESEEQDDPGIASVPPGDYILTLYRVNWTEMQNDGLIADDRPWPGPQEVVVLTPIGQVKPPKNKVYLPFPQPDDAIWKGQYEIEGVNFRGLAMTDYWWSNMNLNLDRAAEAQLGLRPGMIYRVRIENHVFDVLHYGDADLALINILDWNLWCKSIAGSRPEFGVSYRFREFPHHEHSVTFPRVISTTKFSIHNRWLPADVSILPDRIDIPSQYLQLSKSST